jgi:hypothetical protein
MYRIRIYLPDGTEITVLPPKDEPDSRARWRKTVKEVRARLRKPFGQLGRFRPGTGFFGFFVASSAFSRRSR